MFVILYSIPLWDANTHTIFTYYGTKALTILQDFLYSSNTAHI